MRSLRAMWLTVTAFVSLMACGNGCPQISAWRNATTLDGSLVCARVYSGTSCSGFPLQIAINASHAHLHSNLASLGTSESYFTALIRPGCKLRVWSEPNFDGKERPTLSTQAPYRWLTDADAVPPYQWLIDADAVRSARCDCGTDNIELMRCEPQVEMVKIQECDYQNWLAEDEVSAIKAMFPLRFGGRLENPANDVVEKRARYVAPRHKLVVKQVPKKVVGCRMSRHVSTYCKAVVDCSENGFVMASLRHPSDATFAARIIASLHTLGWSSSRGYWTAALAEKLPSDPSGKCRITWPKNSWETNKLGPCSEKRGVLRLSNPGDSWSMTKLRTT